MTFWDDPDLAAGGDYLALGQQGDTISGTITGMRRRVFDDGKVAAELFLQTDGGTVIGGQPVAPGDYSFTCGAYAIKKELNLQRPATGDHVKFVRGALEQLKGGRSVGHYEVVVTHGPGGGQAAQAPPQAQYSQPVQPQQPVYAQPPQPQYQPPAQPQYQQQQPVFAPAPVQQQPQQPGPFQQQGAQPPF